MKLSASEKTSLFFLIFALIIAVSVWVSVLFIKYKVSILWFLVPACIFIFGPGLWGLGREIVLAIKNRG